jgi:RimJ/RimL family protein N-acetyltransferase
MPTTEYGLRLQALATVWPDRLLRLDEETASRRPAAGRWSPKEVVGHLIDSASNNHGRFVRAQLQEALDFPGYDQDAWVDAQRYGDAPWDGLVELWRAFNLHLARVMEAVPESERLRPRVDHNLDRIAWQRPAAGAEVTLDAFMADYVGHLEHHLAQIPGERVPAPPDRIETERLVLRCWHPSDAPLLRDAIDSSLDHLREWMPWAHDEPASLDETRRRMAVWRVRYEVGDDFYLGIFDAAEERVLGATGFHTRAGPGALEIGYWVRADAVRRGVATEAVLALTSAGLSVPGVERIEIRCDARNEPSRRIPERLGYRLVETLQDEGRDTLVFETSTLDRPDAPGREPAGEST